MTYSIDFVFQFIDRTRSTKELNGKIINMRSLRYRTFMEKGTKCVCCGKEGTYFTLDDSSVPGKAHFNLRCADGIIMTKDHILPKSQGGPDLIENMQPMCISCNNKKGDGITKAGSLRRKEENAQYPMNKEMKPLIHMLKEFNKEHHINPFTDKTGIELVDQAAEILWDYHMGVMVKAKGCCTVKGHHLLGVPKKIRREIINTYNEVMA